MRKIPVVEDEQENLTCWPSWAIGGRRSGSPLCSDVRIDLLISDAGLPGFNGVNSIPTAFQRFYSSPAMRNNAAVSNDLLAPGMSTKPFALETLAERIRDDRKLGAAAVPAAPALKQSRAAP